jgi:hypothetical protein
MDRQREHAREGAQPDRRHEDEGEDDLVDAARGVEHLAGGMEHQRARRQVARGEEAQGQGEQDGEKRSPHCQLDGLEHRPHQPLHEGPVGRHHA